MTHWWRRLRRSQDGASAVEFAIVFPVFFLLMFGVFEIARAFWTINTLQYAASQAARYAMVAKPSAGTCCPAAGTQVCPSSYTTSMTAMSTKIINTLGISGVTITPTVSTPSCSASPPTVKVTVVAAYTFTFFLSSSLGSWIKDIQLHQTATVTTPLS